MNSPVMTWLTWLAYTNERAREAERRGIAEHHLSEDPDAPRPQAVLAAAAAVAVLAVLLLGAVVIAAISLGAYV
jgi:hypothetical protein